MSTLSIERNIRGVPVEASLTEMTRAQILRPFSALAVDNSVVYVNPDVEGIQGFEISQPTEYAFQLALGPSRSHPDRLVYGRHGHYRSAIITAQSGISYQGQAMPYLDAKGVGLLGEQPPSRLSEKRVSQVVRPIVIQPTERSFLEKILRLQGGEKTFGLGHRPWIDLEIKNTELLGKVGVRTSPIVAVACVSEVVDEKGGRISVEEAKQRGMINSKTEPAIAFRSWTTPFRMADVVSHYDLKQNSERNHERRMAILERAFQDMRRDPSIPTTFSTSKAGMGDYLEWVAAEIGANMAKMHKAGMEHVYLADLHNITLDGRIVDNDAVEVGRSENATFAEYKNFFSSAGDFFHYFLVYLARITDTRSAGPYLSAGRKAYKESFVSMF